MFKKIYISIKSYIIGKKLLKAQYFININEYEKSGNMLISVINLSHKMTSSKDYCLLKFNICFLTNNFLLCLSLFENTIESIEKTKEEDINVVEYNKLFVYNIRFISNLFLNKNNDLIKSKINDIKIDYSKIPGYEINDYPIYTTEKLVNIYDETGYPDVEEKDLIKVLDELNEFQDIYPND